MNRRPRGNIPTGSWLTLAFTLLAGAMLAATFNLSRPSAWVPQAVLSVTLGLLVWQLIAELRSQAAGANRPGARRARSAVAWLGLLLVVTWLLGAAAGPAVFCLCWLHWHAGERWPPSLAIGAVLGLALWLLFSVLPGVPLYPGAMLRLPG